MQRTRWSTDRPIHRWTSLQDGLMVLRSVWLGYFNKGSMLYKFSCLFIGVCSTHFMYLFSNNHLLHFWLFKNALSDQSASQISWQLELFAIWINSFWTKLSKICTRLLSQMSDYKYFDKFECQQHKDDNRCIGWSLIAEGFSNYE